MGRGYSRRSSVSSIATNSSDIVTASFYGNDSTVVNDLMEAQREIFSKLTTTTATAAVSPPHPRRTGSVVDCGFESQQQQHHHHHPLLKRQQIESIPCRRSSSF